MLVVVQTVQQVRHIVRHGWHFVGFVRLCLIAPFIRGFVVPVQNGVDSAVVIQKIVRVSASAQSVAQFVGGGKLAHFGLIEQIRQTVRNGGDVAEKMLSEKLGEVEYDGLIAGVNPKKRVGPGVIAGPEAETTFVRGTVFAKSAKDGKLHILGTEASGGDTLTADCILIEDVTMKASMDETVAVYLAGCFNPDKLTVKDSYTMTEADKDALRMRDIVLLPVVEM